MTGGGSRAVVVTIVALASLLAGCSRPSTHHYPGTSHDTTTGPVAPATQSPDSSGSDRPDRTVTIDIEGGVVVPAAGRVDVHEGDLVALVVTSDVGDRVQVRGLNRSTRLAAGRPGTMVFTADRVGRFAVEAGESGLLLTELVVR